MISVLPLVEGEGDVEAVPVLLRMICAAHKRYDVDICRPHRRGDIHKVHRRFHDFLHAGLNEAQRLLWIMDCDDGCPLEWLAKLEKLIQDNPPSPQCHLRFAFIVREYESLFLAEQTAAREKLLIEGAFPANVEAIRGAKEWLSAAMPTGRAYKETLDQAAITAQLNLTVLRQKSRSFRHLESAFLSLI